MIIPIKRRIIVHSTSIVKDLYTCTIALLPIIMVYNTPAFNISLGTVLLLLFLPYALLCITRQFNQLNDSFVGIIVIFYVYFIARSQGDVRTILLYFAACVHLCGFIVGSVDANKIRSVIEKIAVISAICIFVQVFSHYLLGRNVSFILFSALQRDYKLIYYEQVSSRFSLYRPTGPFLEPAMLSEYCIFSVISCLFPSDGSIKKAQAIIITTGMILTTSGIGVMLSAFVLGWYFFLKKDSLGKRIRKIFSGVFLAAVVLLILSQFSFFNATIARVFTNYEGYNAIVGRTWRWSQAINPMKGKLLWIGYGATEVFPHYLTGVIDMIFRCGLVAVIIKFILLIDLIKKKDNIFVRLSCIVYLVLFFVAKITSVPYQVFFIGLMVIDVSRNKQWIGENGSNNIYVRKVGV